MIKKVQFLINLVQAGVAGSAVAGNEEEDVSSVETGANETGNANDAAAVNRNNADDVYIRFVSSVFGRGILTGIC